MKVNSTDKRYKLRVTQTTGWSGPLKTPNVYIADAVYYGRKQAEEAAHFIECNSRFGCRAEVLVD
jgi:hypothetical protein